MDFQVLFNIALGGFGVLALFTLKAIWTDIKSLWGAFTTLTQKVQDIEVLVAGKYVTRDELQEIGRDIFNMLHRIEEKLDKKADRNG